MNFNSCLFNNWNHIVFKKLRNITLLSFVTDASFQNSFSFSHKLMSGRKIPSSIKMDRSEMAKLDFLISRGLHP